jgi:hypothetical protein
VRERLKITGCEGAMERLRRGMWTGGSDEKNKGSFSQEEWEGILWRNSLGMS